MGGVEVRLGSCPHHDVDPAVQEIAQAEDHTALDLTVDGAGIDDDAGSVTTVTLLTVIFRRCDAGFGDAGEPGVS